MSEQQGTRIRIEGVRGYDGEYELDINRSWTTREWHWIKRIGGYLPGTINEGLLGGDPELFLALAVIAMVRAGKVDRDDAIRVSDLLMDAPRTAIRLVIEAEDGEGDAGPPDLTSAPDESSPNGTRSRSSISGSGSSPSSDRSDESPAPTGITESVSQDTLAQTR